MGSSDNFTTKQTCNFTKSNLDALTTESKPYTVWDEGGKMSEASLSVLVRPTGTKSFQVYQKFQGKPLRVTLGRYPKQSIENARKAARQAVGKMYLGINPNQEKQAARERGISVEDALKNYLVTKNLANSTTKAYRMTVNKYLGDWKDRELLSIKDSDVKAKYKKVSSKSIESANKAMRVLRAVHNHAFFRDKSIENPVDVLTVDGLWKTSKPRAARLLESQFKPWFDTLDLIDTIHADYLRFVLLTGVRRREATTLRPSAYDADSKTVEIYASKTDSTYLVHLSDYLVPLVERRINQSDEWLFPSNYSASGHLEEPKSSLAKIEKLSGINVSTHALRRTFISIAADMEIPQSAIKALVNHAKIKSDVTETHYINFEAKQLSRYNQRITDKILELAERKPSNVIDITSKRNNESIV